ncbi:MAG TPA: YbaB/EbfC family nucleoid-associated protein [Phycisphaerae bacterium]|nr:YbaB/EbfC family nucleoid-associated protein [Phycisphaerae bacterium]
MFGSLGNLGSIMKQAKAFQDNLKRVQEEMARKRFDADAGAGMVVATVDGRGELVRIKIDPRAAEDVELLEDLVKAAIGAAASKAQDAMKDEMAQLTGGLNLPGLTDLLGQGT